MTACLPEPLTDALAGFRARVLAVETRRKLGIVRDVKGAVITATLPRAPVGAICELRRGDVRGLAEVIGTAGDRAILSPFDGATGLSSGLPVRLVAECLTIPVGTALLGRVLDGLGRPIDGLGPLVGASWRPANAPAPDPVGRPLIDTPLATGIRAIDAFCAIGRGQRLGIFGPPGVGKSVLLSALARNAEADAIVIGLIGERGREVREFIDRSLPPEYRAQTVVVAATSNRPPLERLYAARAATAIAEDLRDQGMSVLLLIDSLTRVARAVREIGLAAGEPPTRRGYPASVYAALPQLIERSGRTEAGDITALYTVLIEGDGEGDPIAEEVRSLTDGHIILKAAIAARGRYPAIDVLSSLSRLMAEIVPEHRQDLARQARAALAKYAEIELLLQVGEYQPGADPAADHALAVHPALEAFLSQKLGDEVDDPDGTWRGLAEALASNGGGGM